MAKAGAFVKSAFGCAAAAVLCACSAAEPRQAENAAEDSAARASFVPTGARLEPSGYATVDEVPPMPLPAPEAPEQRPGSEEGWYAQMAGISEAEARKRLKEQQASRAEFERVLALVRRHERGNFTAVRMIHRPDWANVFYFKRDPQRTLAKYTRNPHFKAAKADYSEEELRAIAQPWIERFERHRMLDGYGVDATHGEIGFSLAVTEDEFRHIASGEGWGAIPAPLKLQFAGAPAGEAVPAQIRRLVRIFPQRDRALGATNLALASGRITLRDGCFYVGGPGEGANLAYFPREFALAVDPQGYLAIRSRLPARPGEPAGRLIGRIGEEFVWGGPIAMSDDLPMVRELRERCGNAPIVHLGMLTSARQFERDTGVQTTIRGGRGPPPVPPTPPAPQR